MNTSLTSFMADRFVAIATFRKSVMCNVHVHLFNDIIGAYKHNIHIRKLRDFLSDSLGDELYIASIFLKEICRTLRSDFSKDL